MLALRWISLLSLLSISAFAQPTLSSVSPSAIAQTSQGFTLSLSGTGFSALNRVEFSGALMTTNFVSSTQLTAVIPASALAPAGLVFVRVRQSVLLQNFSNSVPFNIIPATPTLTSLSPSSASIGGSGFNLTVTGTNFFTGAIVRLGGINMPTTVTSQTQVVATIPASSLANVGSLSVVVDNAGVGGTSGSLSFTVTNVVPSIATVSPNIVNAGLPSVNLTLLGSNFNTTSVVKANGTAIPTTPISGATMAAVLPGSFLNGAGTINITVENPGTGGGTSGPRVVTVNAPTPSVASLSPSSTFVQSPAVEVALLGTNFIPSTTVTLTGVGALPTTFVSATEIRGTIPATSFLTFGSLELKASTPGVPLSNARSFLVINSTPIIQGIQTTPQPLLAGFPGLISVTGVGFHGGTKALIGATEFIPSTATSTQFTVVVPAATFQAATSITLTANNPGPGGGTSNAVAFQVINPPPAPATISPGIFIAGSPDTPATLNGAGFTSTTQVTVNNRPVATTFVSSTQLSLIVPASSLHVAGTMNVSTTNPPPGGGTTPLSPVQVTGPLVSNLIPLSIAPLSPSSFPVALTVEGFNFTPTMVVRANGTPITSIFIDPSEIIASLSATIPTATVPGGVAITVTEGTTITSNAVTLRVVNGPLLANVGLITLSPVPPVPGAQFQIRTEVPGITTPFTLVADLGPANPLTVAIGANSILAVGVGTGSIFPLADGLGIFGPPDSTATLGASVIPPFFVFGSHNFGPIQAPPSVAGITFSLQAAFADANAPSGINLTYPSYLHSL